MPLAPGGPTWILLAASGLNLGLAVIAVRRRGVRGAVPFAAILVCVSLYALGDAVRAGSTTLATYRVGTLVNYVGFLGLAPATLWFALTFSGRESLLDRRLGVALLVEPVAVFALVATAPMHDLMWTVDGFAREPPLALVNYAFGPVFWLNVAYEYAIIVPSLALVGFVAVRNHRQYRIQVALFLIGALVPLGASLAWVFGVAPLDSVDPTSFAFTATGIAFAIALFRFGFLDLVPVARHTLVDEMSDPIFVVDDVGRLVDLNAAAAGLLDGEEGAVGQPAADVVPSYDALGDDGDSSGADVVVESGDGERYFDANRTTLTDRTGSAIGSLLIYRDVTERHIVEKRFQRLIERSSDVVTVLDEDGTITYVSPSIEEVLGYQPADLIGENIVNRVHPDDREGVVAELAAHVDDPGYADRYVARYSDADGDWRIIEARAANLLEDPYVEGIVLNSRDVTEQRRRERQLEAQNERLDEFASVVSHDLRNPLTVLSGRLESARETGDPDHVDAAIDAVDRMETIIDDLRRLARQGTSVGELEECDLSTAVRRAWESVPTDDARLVCRADATVEADEGLLVQALENLFRNAVEHGARRDGPADVADCGSRDHERPVRTDDGSRPLYRGGDAHGVDASVTVTVDDSPEGFYVADDGAGIPAEKRDEVFEYGYSGDDGTGLGLTIVQRIAEAHGWSVTAGASADGGARFEFSDV